MKLYSNEELQGIIGIVNSPQYNMLRLRITTDRPLPLDALIVEQPVEGQGKQNAQLGGYAE